MSFYVSAMEENILPSAVVYMRRTGEYGEENRKLMNDFKKWIKANNLYDADTVVLAVPLDDPSKTEACKCRYDVCMNNPARKNFDSKSVKCRNIDGGKYVTFLIFHTVDAVQAAWEQCFNELSKQGYSLDVSRPIMERYKSRLVGNHYCELCVPVL